MRLLIDLVRRRTPPQDKEAHEVFALAMAAGESIEQQEEEINRAWADANQTAWREIAGKQLQALVTMTGVKPDGKGGFISGAEGVRARGGACRAGEAGRRFRQGAPGRSIGT